jgi:hypothetical protein
MDEALQTLNQARAKLVEKEKELGLKAEAERKKKKDEITKLKN